MTTLPIAVIVGIVGGGVLGIFIARRSADQDAVLGGGVARALHYAAAASFGGLLPATLTAIILGNGIVGAFIMVGVFLTLCWLALFGYALAERPARAALATDDDPGWTEEKARSSGL